MSWGNFFLVGKIASPVWVSRHVEMVDGRCKGCSGDRGALAHTAVSFRQLEDQGVFEASEVLPMALEHPIRLQEPLMEVP